MSKKYTTKPSISSSSLPSSAPDQGAPGVSKKYTTKPSISSSSLPSSAPDQGALGSIAKSVSRCDVAEDNQSQQKQGRTARFRHQRHAVKLLPSHRVSKCRWAAISRAEGVDVVTTERAELGKRGKDGKRAKTGKKLTTSHFEGVQTCGSVWVCPCCSAKVSDARRKELNHLLEWARCEGHGVHMVTLTARHGREDDLGDLLDDLKTAKQAWARHRAYVRFCKRYTVLGSVTATEVTGGGAHGWHPHFHMLFVTAAERVTPEDMEALRGPWLSSLAGVGLDGAGSAFHAADASETGAYVAKWGAAEELALTGKKKGRSGRTPFQLLAAASDEGDRAAGHLFQEFAEAFRKRHQMDWTRGLKSMASIKQVTDAQAAADAVESEQVETGRANIVHDVWAGPGGAGGARERRAELLDIADEQGAAAAAAQASAPLLDKLEVFESWSDPASGFDDSIDWLKPFI